MSSPFLTNHICVKLAHTYQYNKHICVQNRLIDNFPLPNTSQGAYKHFLQIGEAWEGEGILNIEM